MKCAERVFRILVHPRLVYQFSLETYAHRTSDDLNRYLWTLSLALDLAWKSSCGHLPFHQHFFSMKQLHSCVLPHYLAPDVPPSRGFRLPALSQHTLSMCRHTCLLKCTPTMIYNGLPSDGLILSPGSVRTKL